MRKTLMLAASAAVIAWGTTAHAQETDDQNKSKGVETVVVTAERRSEDVQKTAIAATVISGADLANKGVTNVDQLQFIAPAVAVDNFGQGIDFNIRGIGKAEHNSQTTTGVITYRDGVATFPGYVTEEPYYDIANIQILRGPQGTFVGSNATGGAVFVNTNDPIIGGGYSGYVQAEAGNYSDFGAQGSVNIPISDTFAARVALFGQSRDSFYHVTGPGGAPYTGNKGDQRWGAGRVSLLWKPTDALSVLFKTDIDYLDNGAYPADPVLSTNDPFHITANAPQRAIDRFVRSSLKVDYVMPNGITLRSISAYQQASTMYQADLDGTNYVYHPTPPAATGTESFFQDNVNEKIWSQEVNVISPDTGPVTWVLGALAQSDEYDFRDPYQFQIITQPGGLLNSYFLQGKNPKTAFAGFGQVSVDLPKGFQVQFGARYSYASTKNSNVSIVQFGLPIADDQKVSFNNFSYKGTLSYTVNDNNFLYGFVATGFRPGGLNVPVSGALLDPFGSEKVQEYEVGWKTTAFDGHLNAQFDGYYNNYRNFQVSVSYPLFPVFAVELNDPKPTKIYGIEAETQAVFGNLSFDGGIGLMHSSLGQFFATDPRGFGITLCDPATGPASLTCINLKGHRQTYAPNFTFKVGVQYNFALGNGDTLTPRANYGHVSSQWATLFENEAAGDRVEERNLLGAQLAWTHGDYVATLYGTNLTDQHYVGAVNTGLRFVGPPRQFGIRVMKVF